MEPSTCLLKAIDISSNSNLCVLNPPHSVITWTEKEREKKLGLGLGLSLWVIG